MAEIVEIPGPETLSVSRPKLNANFETIAALFYGATAPTRTFPYMLWADTTTGYIQQRSAADDAVAKKKFEERRAPQFLGGLAEIYGKTAFAAGDLPTFADCMVHEAVAWCVRRNDVCKALFEASPSLVAFRDRFTSIPAIRASGCHRPRK